MAKARKHALDVESPVEVFSLDAQQGERCVLFAAHEDFEMQLKQSTGAFKYDQGTIAFTQKPWEDREKVRIQNPELSLKASEDASDEKDGNLRVIAALRHWLFHSTSYHFSASDVLARMGRTLHLLSGLQHGQDCPPGDGPPEGWSRWQSMLDEVLRTKAVHVQLKIQSNRMRIPIPDDRVFEGREKDLESVVKSLLQPGARVSSPIALAALACPSSHVCAQVLLQGVGGIGKDMVAAKVVLDPRIAKHPELIYQVWLQGSSDEVFQRQLLSFFEQRLPEIVFGVEQNATEALARIREWLLSNDGWLLVIEDATRRCASLVKFLSGPLGRGRVLYTSQERLDIQNNNALCISAHVALSELKAEQCLAIWREMGLFVKASRASAKQDLGNLTEGTLVGVVCAETK